MKNEGLIAMLDFYTDLSAIYFDRWMERGDMSDRHKVLELEEKAAAVARMIAGSNDT